MSNTILVTGASGFVGRHCLGPLAEAGFEVHALSRSRHHAEDVTWHQGDLLDQSERRAVLKAVSPSHLMHLAWYLEPGKYVESLYNLDWLAASVELIRDFAGAGGSRVVTAGSCFEYDWTDPVLSEKTPLRPRTFYGRCKALLFEALTGLSERGGPSMAWARLFFLFGPGEDVRRLAASVASALLAGRQVATSEGIQRRDYMYVRDAGRALASLLASTVEGPVNIATGRAIEVGDLIRAISFRAGNQHLLQMGARPTAPEEPAHIEANIERLKREVGFDNFTDLDMAVDETVDWWRNSLSTAPA